jgi:hypothetical protein
VGFLDSVCYFLQRLAHWSDRFLDLLVYWCKGVLLDILAGWVFGIFKLIPALFCSPTFYAIFPVLKFLLGDMYRYRRICCTEIELPIIGWCDACSWRRMRYNGGDLCYALGNFLPIMVAFIHQNSKVSTPKFSFASKAIALRR